MKNEIIFTRSNLSWDKNKKILKKFPALQNIRLIKKYRITRVTF